MLVFLQLIEGGSFSSHLKKWDLSWEVGFLKVLPFSSNVKQIDRITQQLRKII